MNENIPQPQPLVFIETYGCQMNKCDSEIVLGILGSNGMQAAVSAEEADIILVNTCSRFSPCTTSLEIMGSYSIGMVKPE